MPQPATPPLAPAHPCPALLCPTPVRLCSCGADSLPHFSGQGLALYVWGTAHLLAAAKASPVRRPPLASHHSPPSTCPHSPWQHGPVGECLPVLMLSLMSLMSLMVPCAS